MTNADESVRRQVGSQVGISEFTSMLQLGLIRICWAYPYREMQIKKGGGERKEMKGVKVRFPFHTYSNSMQSVLFGQVIVSIYPPLP